MSIDLINIGFGNFVSAERVIAVVNPVSSPMRRLREDAKAGGRLVDATEGRKTRSVIIMDSNHVILSALQMETVNQRVQTERARNTGKTQKEDGAPQSGYNEFQQFEDDRPEPEADI